MSQSLPQQRPLLQQQALTKQKPLLQHQHDRVQRSVEDFRQAIGDYLAGKLDEATFTALRLRNGLFCQNGHWMLRIAIPDGVLRSAQLRRLAALQQRYADGYAHLTTRQNIQIYDLQLDEVSDLLGALTVSGLYTVQTSGPCIRAITIEPLAGLATDEVDDPRPWSLLLQRWSTLHPGLSNLPRKLKVAISASRHERIAVRAHDIGLRLTVGRAEQARFALWVGGGLGRKPQLAQLLYDELPGAQLLLYLEALLRLYNRDAPRHDKRKARLKFFVNEHGVESIRTAIEKELGDMTGRETEALIVDARRYAGALSELVPPLDDGRDGRNSRSGRRPQPLLHPAADAEVAVGAASVNGSVTAFAAAAEAAAEDDSPEALLAAQVADNPEFARWLNWNSEPQRQPALRAVTICLRGRGHQTPGNVSSVEMERLAWLAESINGGELRCTQQQHWVLPHVPLDRLYGVWRVLHGMGLAEPIVGTVADPLACPGKARCELANAPTAAVAHALQQRLQACPAKAEALGSARLSISGCMNGCALHSISEIGLRGVDKQGEAWFQILIGGKSNGDLRLGEVLGPAVSEARVPAVVEALVDRYLELRHSPQESFSAAVARLGTGPFRCALQAGESAQQGQPGQPAQSDPTGQSDPPGRRPDPLDLPQSLGERRCVSSSSATSTKSSATV
ncbi:hypothetical protein CKO15_10585 [Halorhodospira abdelmalekii]|uniref:nitrite/sulfite reductase n=1 Tax=Halorhodospira abdelmalekii TaxID=421629 RepID=UPI00190533E3|nr:nitrite/sulfite reductase [Halorhodospira abdelmalekii]MBK1735719.1 hypothetical protein [Halorhodospira abdelmalekii]